MADLTRWPVPQLFRPTPPSRIIKGGPPTATIALNHDVDAVILSVENPPPSILRRSVPKTPPIPRPKIVNPPLPTDLRDTFTRSVTDGWGTPDVGPPWVPSTTAADYDVDGSVGTITGTGDHYADSFINVSDLAASGRFKSNQVPPASTLYIHLGWIRSFSDTSGYNIYVDIAATTGAMKFSIARMDTSSVLGGVFNLPTYVADTWYKYRILAVGSRIRVKVWEEGTSEPDWQRDVTDTIFASPQKYRIGCAPFDGGIVVSRDDINVGPPFETLQHTVDAVISAGAAADIPSLNRGKTRLVPPRQTSRLFAPIVTARQTLTLTHTVDAVIGVEPSVYFPFKGKVQERRPVDKSRIIAPAPVQRSFTLRDNFDDNVLDPMWTAVGTGISETNNRLQMSWSDTSERTIRSVARYSLVDSWVHAELLEVPQSGGGYAFILATPDDGTNGVRIAVTPTQIFSTHIINGTPTDINTASYDPQVHRWFRIRTGCWGASNGTTFYEYSTNGVDWITLASEANPVSLDRVEVRVGAATASAPSGTVTTIWDNFNKVPIRKFREGFDGASVNTGRWSVWTTSVVNGRARFPLDSGSGEINTLGRYDFTGSTAEVELTGFTQTTTNVDWWFALHFDGDKPETQQNGAIVSRNSVYWELWNPGSGLVLRAAKNVNGVQTVLRQDVTYDANVHRWFRHRESGGTLFWDYSTDGINWTNYWSEAAWFDTGWVSIDIAGADWDDTGGNVEVDNVNSPPNALPFQPLRGKFQTPRAVPRPEIFVSLPTTISLTHTVDAVISASQATPFFPLQGKKQATPTTSRPKIITPPPSITYLGNLGSANGKTTSVSSLAMTVTQDVPVGALVLVFSGVNDATGFGSTLADSKGNTWTKLDDGFGYEITFSFERAGGTFWACNLTTPLVAGDTITVTYPGSTTAARAITADAFMGPTLANLKGQGGTIDADTKPHTAKDFVPPAHHALLFAYISIGTPTTDGWTHWEESSDPDNGGANWIDLAGVGTSGGTRSDNITLRRIYKITDSFYAPQQIGDGLTTLIGGGGNPPWLFDMTAFVRPDETLLVRTTSHTVDAVIIGQEALGLGFLHRGLVRPPYIAPRPRIVPPAFPPIGTLTDDFTTLDTSKWAVWNSSVVGGRYRVELDGAYGQVDSIGYYDLTGGAAFVEIQIDQPFLADQDVALGLFFDVNHRDNPADLNSFQWSNGLYFAMADFGGGINLQAIRKINGSNTTLASTPYDPYAHHWVKVRESGGTIFWEFSSDGIVWTSFASCPVWTSIGKTMVELVGGNITTDTNTFVWFDNFNVVDAAEIPLAPFRGTAQKQPTLKTRPSRIVVVPLSLTTSTRTHTVDAVVLVSFGVSHQVDAVIAGVIPAFLPTVGVLQKPTNRLRYLPSRVVGMPSLTTSVRTHTVDAVILVANNTRTHTVDAVITGVQPQFLPISRVLQKRVNLPRYLPSRSLGTPLPGTRFLSHAVDAVVLKTFIPSYTVDAFIATIEPQGTPIFAPSAKSANLSRSLTSRIPFFPSTALTSTALTHTVDAVILAAFPVVLRGDKKLVPAPKARSRTVGGLSPLATSTLSHSVDAVIAGVVGPLAPFKPTYKVSSRVKYLPSRISVLPAQFTQAVNHQVDAFIVQTTPYFVFDDAFRRTSTATRVSRSRSYFFLPFPVTFTRTHTVDAVVFKTITQSHTVDAVIAGVIPGFMPIAPVVQKRVNLVRSLPSRVAYMPSQTTSVRTHTVDAVILVANNVRTHTVTAVVLKTFTLTHTVTAVVLKTSALTHTVDAVVLKTLTRTHTVDAVIQVAFFITHQVDAVIEGVIPVFQPSKGVVKSTNRVRYLPSRVSYLPSQTTSTRTHTVDAVILDADNPLTYTVDAAITGYNFPFIPLKPVYKVTSRSVYRSTRIPYFPSRTSSTRQHFVDAVILVVFSPAHTVTSVVLKANNTRSHQVTVEVGLSYKTRTHQVDAYIFLRHPRWPQGTDTDTWPSSSGVRWPQTNDPDTWPA